MRSWLRSPLLHFAVGGGLILAGRLALDRAESAPPRLPEREPIVVSAADVRRLEAEFRARFGARPRPEQVRTLVEETVQQEVLYREARRLALDFADPSVRRRLVEKMRVLAEPPLPPDEELVRQARELGLEDDVVIRRLLAEKMRVLLRQGATGAARLDDAELRDLLERHRARFQIPETITFSHVFLSAGSRGGEIEADAAAVLARLRTAGSSDRERVETLSDPFPLGLHLRSQTRLKVQGHLGKDLADRVFALEPGRWSDPIPSPYGLHLVRVEEIRPERLPPLAELRDTLTRIAVEERARQNLAEGLRRLRSLYEVRIEDERLLAESEAPRPIGS